MEATEDTPAADYAWEGQLERTWNHVQETHDGTLASTRKPHFKQKHNVQLGVKRGLMRSVLLVMDASKAAMQPDADMKPTRLAVLQDAAVNFIQRFFDQNPVSTLGVVRMRDSKAELITPLSCNSRQHVQSVRNIDDCSGIASLQNALELCCECLGCVASFVSQEVIILSASLASCDPGDVSNSISRLVQDRIRCSVFSVTAEVYVCRKIARETGGEYGVAIQPEHLQQMMYQLVAPRALNTKVKAPPNSLVRVGFPSYVPPSSQMHLVYTGGQPTLKADGGYECPKCAAFHAEIPTECPLCGLKLIAATDLVKTYHHLFPLQVFHEKLGKREALCDACGVLLPSAAGGDTQLAMANQPLKEVDLVSVGYSCPECGQTFCADCDDLLHDCIFTCPGCLRK